jgi:hypothetical protein
MLLTKLKLFFILFSLLLISSLGTTLYAQNLDKIGKDDMVKVGGGLNFNSILLNTNNANSTRAPLSWYLNGNVTVSFLDWSFPFTYSYSNQHSSYTQPFNQTGISPTYKWIKTYIGTCNMNFSQYSYSGIPFLGGGVELSPKNWKVAFMYGRLKKAVEYDAINESDLNMSYKRMGMGAKVGYEKSGYGLSLIWFEAKDVQNSLSFIPAVTAVQPQENTVVSATAKAPITKYFNVAAEYSLSGFTRNSFAEQLSSTVSGNKLPIIFQPRTNSQFFSAFKSSVNFNSKFFSCGANFERIDPNYQTLGIYYMNNDIENITLSPQVRLLKNKLNIALNTGIQHNNLENEKLSTTYRLVGSGNITYQPTPHWSAMGSYSNFTSYSKNRPLTDPFYQPSPLDTMKFYQVSQNATATLNHTFGKTKLKHNITFMAAYQVSKQETGSVESAPITLLNGNVAYGIVHVKTKTMISISANANQTTVLNSSTVYYGPGITVGKSFFSNMMNVTLGSIYNLSYNENKNNGSVINERLNLGYNPKVKNKKYGKPNLSVSANYMTRLNAPVGTASVHEFTGNINLGYVF